MTEFTHLWLFFLMVLGIIVLPGMDMAFVIASALAGGRNAGAFAVAGIVAGGVCHVAAGALGVGLLFKLVPGLIDVMLVVGALYVILSLEFPRLGHITLDDFEQELVALRKSM